MLEELRQIDVSAIAELVRIKQEEQLLRERLSKMESSKEKVSAVVYKRVRADYESRQAALDVESRPLKDRARKEYARLRNLRAEVEKAVEEVSLEKEELEFRRELGEFPGEEFRTKLAESEERLAGKRQELAEIDQLKQQFISAFHAESDLEASGADAAPGPQPPPPEKPREEETVVSSAASPSPMVTVVTAQPTAAPSPPARKITTPIAAGTPSSAPTMKLVMPRIVKLVEDRPAEEYDLKPGTTISIGRSPKNEISLPYGEVSRHHADIIFTNEGFRIVDLGSGNGVIVNGKRVKEHPLVDGDVIQIGMRKLVYRA